MRFSIAFITLVFKVRTRFMKSLLIFTIVATFSFWDSESSAQYICVKGNCINGTGKKQVEGSSAYIQGKFMDGILREGKVVFPNGSVFNGKFKEHKLVEGLKIFPNGSKLEGRFVEEVLVEGRITYQNGTSRLIKMKPLGGQF